MALAVKHENDRKRVCWGPTCIYIRNITLHYAALHYIPLHSIPLHYIYHYISIYSKASAHITRITHTRMHQLKRSQVFFPFRVTPQILGESPGPGPSGSWGTPMRRSSRCSLELVSSWPPWPPALEASHLQGCGQRHQRLGIKLIGLTTLYLNIYIYIYVIINFPPVKT